MLAFPPFVFTLWLCWLCVNNCITVGWIWDGDRVVCASEHGDKRVYVVFVFVFVYVLYLLSFRGNNPLACASFGPNEIDSPSKFLPSPKALVVLLYLTKSP